MKKIILVTGGTGFIGSYLARALFKEGHRIIILKRATSLMTALHRFKISNRIEYFEEGNLPLDFLFDQNKIDAIIHMATEYGRQDHDKSSVYQANLDLPIKLLDLAVRYQVPKFINTDTYFSKFKEYPYLNNYITSKKLFLEYFIGNSSKVEKNNLRLEHIYGPYDSNAKFTEMLFQKIAVNKVENIKLTSGDQKRDFIYVEDAIKAFLTIINREKIYLNSFKNYEVGTGSSIKIKDFAMMIKLFSKSPTKLLFGDIKYRDDEIMESVADLKSLTSIGWKPDVDIESGIKKILEIYKNEK